MYVHYHAIITFIRIYLIFLKICACQSAVPVKEGHRGFGTFGKETCRGASLGELATRLYTCYYRHACTRTHTCTHMCMLVHACSAVLRARTNNCLNKLWHTCSCQQSVAIQFCYT